MQLVVAILVAKVVFLARFDPKVFRDENNQEDSLERDHERVDVDGEFRLQRDRESLALFHWWEQTECAINHKVLAHRHQSHQ